MKPTATTICSLLGVLLVALTGCQFPVTGWPIEPMNTEHVIGNSGGEFQQYGSAAPYFHTGLDIVDDSAPSGPFVRTTRRGTPTLSLPGAMSTQNGLTVRHAGTSGDDIYLYWHLDLNSVTQAARDAEVAGVIAAGTRVAQLHIWPVCDYHHLHYSMANPSGSYDPIFYLRPRRDRSNPVIDAVFFTRNATNNQFATDGSGRPRLNGLVDVIAQARDTQFGAHRTGVMTITFRVTRQAGGRVQSGRVIFLHRIPPDADADVLHRNSAPFDSDSDYCGTETYFYVLTNWDNSTNSFSENNGFWNTRSHPNGIYTVEVLAIDARGNRDTFTQEVRIDNRPGLAP